MIRFYLIAPEPSGTNARLGGEGGFVTAVPSAAIATVAALAPADFDVQLCDESIEPVDFATEVDVVGITANVSQAQRALQIADEFRARGKTVVVGGPHVSLAPQIFEGRADSLVIGELESIAEQFFTDMRSGALAPRYQGGKADLTLSPPPRWDLYSNEGATDGLVQTSRGCPFECNFCDVIQYLGRVQRHKRDDQVIAEVQTLYDLGYNSVFLADDNFTVYRKRAKSLLKALAAWNGAEGRDYVRFGTQMSVDVARDPELMSLCNEAGLLNAFIGIESSDAGSLTESRKRQNLQVDLVEECAKVTRAGMQVQSGLMVGFDSDDLSVFQRQFDFAMALPVAKIRLSVLVAPIGTPLYASLLAEGRILTEDLADRVFGTNLTTNMRPAQMSPEDLFIGAKWLINKVFDPDNFFFRLKAMADMLGPPVWVRKGHSARKRRHPSRRRVERAVAGVMRDLNRRDMRIADLILRCFGLMRERPEIRDSINDALGVYLWMLRVYELDGVYERGWAELPAPPFRLTHGSEPTRFRRAFA